MNLKLLISKTSEWLKGVGPDSEIVMSSRIRLARNITKYPFPNRASAKEKEAILKLMQKALTKNKYLQKSLFLDIEHMDAVDKQFLVERHLMSREHAGGDFGHALIIGDDELLSIMINEEDHLRLQVIQSGFQLFEALDIASKIDIELENSLEYAFSSEWGYLTACPTNVGTGLRASVMLHLPALILSKQINQVLQATSKLGLAIRGLYGEGTEALGNLFQISNHTTLGASEEDITRNISKVIRQIIEHEKNARNFLLKKNRTELENRVWRAYGILNNARIINSTESIELLSTVRLGLDLEIIDEGLIKRENVNELFILTQPAHLQKITGEVLDAKARDLRRANLLREKFQKIDNK